MFHRTGVIAIEVLRRVNSDFRPFHACDLDLDPMTFINEHDPHSLEIYQMCKYELLRPSFRKFSSDSQTNLLTYLLTYLPRRICEW